MAPARVPRLHEVRRRVRRPVSLLLLRIERSVRCGAAGLCAQGELTFPGGRPPEISSCVVAAGAMPFEAADAALGGDSQVGTDSGELLGSGQRAQAAREPLPNLDHPEVTLGCAAIERHPRIDGEPGRSPCWAGSRQVRASWSLSRLLALPTDALRPRQATTRKACLAAAVFS